MALAAEPRVDPAEELRWSSDRELLDEYVDLRAEINRLEARASRILGEIDVRSVES